MKVKEVIFKDFLKSKIVFKKSSFSYWLIIENSYQSKIKKTTLSIDKFICVPFVSLYMILCRNIASFVQQRYIIQRGNKNQNMYNIDRSISFKLLLESHLLYKSTLLQTYKNLQSIKYYGTLRRYNLSMPKCRNFIKKSL